jgi:hypothetical protein
VRGGNPGRSRPTSAITRGRPSACRRSRLSPPSWPSTPGSPEEAQFAEEAMPVQVPLQPQSSDSTSSSRDYGHIGSRAVSASAQEMFAQIEMLEKKVHAMTLTRQLLTGRQELRKKVVFEAALTSFTLESMASEATDAIARIACC